MEAKELELSVRDHEECNEENSNGQTSTTTINHSPNPKLNTLTRWVRIAVCSTFLLSGQGVATLLGRLYFEKGGASKWMATLVQLVGFPVLLPIYSMILFSPKKITKTEKQPRYSKLVIVSFYIVLGIITAFYCYLYSVGLMYIPVSTYSLICASQLAFNAFFSYFLNKQKFTPYIINCLVLLSISSVLLVFNSDSENDDDRERVSKGKYRAGFVCTVGASAGYGLVLSLTQFFINRVLRREDFRVIVDMTFLTSLVASIVAVAGLFGSGEWARLGREMESFGLGRVSYVMILTWTAISWQLFNLGNVALIIEVSSLFSNVISVLGLPVVPVLGVFLFGEKMNGLKVVAMLLAGWGFVSYAYQNYLDTQVTKKDCSKSEKEALESERDQ